RGDQALLVRRSFESRPGRDPQKGARAQGWSSAGTRSRRFRDLRKRLRQQLLDGLVSRHVVVDELGGAVRGGEKSRDGDGDPNSGQIPTRLLLDRRLLHSRGGVEAQGSP